MENNKIDLWPNMDFIDWLQILFIAFKLAGLVDWSWWLVICPMLVKLGIGIITVIAWFILSFVAKKNKWS